MPEVNAVVVESKRPEVPAPALWGVRWRRKDGSWCVHMLDESEAAARKYLEGCTPEQCASLIKIPAEHSHADEREGELHENGCECGGTADPELCLRAGCERRAAK